MSIFLSGVPVDLGPDINPAYQPHRVKLSITGNGTGSVDGAIDASAVGVELYVDSDGGVGATTFDVRQVVVTIADNGFFRADEYGNLSTLTTGVEIEHRTSADALIRKITAAPVQANRDWGRNAGANFELLDAGSLQQRVLLVTVSLASWHDQGLVLASGEKLVTTLDDDFSGLQIHEFLAVGYTG